MENNSEMRIIQLISCRNFSSEAWRALNLSASLQKRGHKIWVGYRKDRGEAIKRNALALGIKESNIIPFHFNNRFHLWQDGCDVLHLARLVNETGASIVHAHRGNEHWVAAIALAFLRSKVKLVRTRHGLSPMHNTRRNEWVLNVTNRMVTICREVQESFIKNNSMKPKNVSCIYSGAILPPKDNKKGLHLRSYLGISPEAILIGAVSSFQKDRGQLILLEAMSQIVSEFPDARLVLAGIGSEPPYITEIGMKVKELGLEGKVYFLGQRKSAEDVLQAIDIGVYACTESNGPSRSLLEYLAYGKASIATSVGMVPEIITNKQNGLMIKENDPVALANSLRAYLSDDEMRNKLATQARKSAEDIFQLDCTVKSTEKMYQSLLDEAK